MARENPPRPQSRPHDAGPLATPRPVIYRPRAHRRSTQRGRRRGFSPPRWEACVAAALVALWFAVALWGLPVGKELPADADIPAEVRAILAPERLALAVNYSNFGYGWYFFTQLFNLLLLSGLLAFGVSARLRDAAARGARAFAARPAAPWLGAALAGGAGLWLSLLAATTEHPFSTGNAIFVAVWVGIGWAVGASPRFGAIALYLLVFSALMLAVEFPLSVYGDFTIEHYYGLSKMSFGRWLAEGLRGTLMGWAFTLLLVPAFYWVIRRRERDWWLWASLATLPLLLLMLVIGPVYLAPLMETFTPLRDEALRTRLLSLAHGAGIPSAEVLQVAKAAKTEAVNAYVTGLLGTQRIVLWDTLLAALNGDEVAAVMAHEMGHYLLQHVWWTVAIGVVLLAAVFYGSHLCAGWVLRRYGRVLGFNSLGDIASYPLILLLISLLGFAGSPVNSAISRHMEREADRFGLELTGNGEHAASAFTKLANFNLAHPDPPALFQFWLHGHPSLKERIETARAYRKP